MKKIILYCSCILLGALLGLVLDEVSNPDKHENPKEEKTETHTIIVQETQKFPHTPLGKFEITFYTPTGSRTATGTKPKEGRTIAVDPKIIPYGSVVYIEGHGYFIAEDCGGAVKGKIIDIFLNTTNEKARKRGRKLNVRVHKMEL